MKKHILNLAICASLSLYGAHVAAAIDYTAGGSAVNYPATMKSTGKIATPENTKFKLDKAIDSGIARFVRIELSGGSATTKFSSSVTGLNLTVTSKTPTIKEVQGGAGYNYVIFRVVPTSASTGVLAEPLVVDDIVNFTSGSIDIGGSSDILFSYGLFETVTEAANPDAPGSTVLASLDNMPYIHFAAPYSLQAWSGGAIAELVADVVTGFTEFKDPPKLPKTGVLAQFNLAKATSLMDPSSTTGSSIALSGLLSDSVLTLNGDFSFIFSQDMTTDTGVTEAKQRLFVSADGKCDNTFNDGTTDDIPVTDIAEDGSSVSFNVIKAVPTTVKSLSLASSASSFIGSNKVLCATTNTGVDGTNVTGEIPEIDIAADFISVAESGYSAYDLSNVVIGKIKHNGAQLITPFFTMSTQYIPRFYLNNRGDAEATYEIKVLSDFPEGDANALVLQAGSETGTIPAGGNLLLKSTDFIASGKRGAAIFNVAGECEDISGIFQVRTSRTSGDFDTIPMQMPSGYCID
ncbi:hypothetical protein QUF61_16635 [Candidatus Venteria ishoeyi]|uniref:hypothetical protein n=1 Tax=Candidatus Venteria ishoeyi TaxID=1899563 RepID=UPI0025A4DDEB|nr:hypothetical protein [Candidatus Venteria ishoeyi]MDM8548117.1 hypothetical protein [Candidatus Venteria ishoeyi]